MDGSESTELNVDEKDKIFIIQENPYFVAIVYPQKNRLDAKGASARPGVVVKTARMTKKRCRTCKGRENCHHLIIVRLAESENNQSASSELLKEKENNAKQTEFETDLVEGWKRRKLEPKGKSQSKNAKNPENFHGDHANVFNQEFQYPPSQEDKVKNNRINVVENIFPSKMMIPKGLQSEKCDCGNTFDCKEFESKHPVIHHGKRTKDSRNDILSLYYLGTTKCECRKYYHGEEDKLVRVSAAPAQPQAKVNFVSVDLLNEYLTSLFGSSQEGKSIDAFVKNKNDLNKEQRGDDIEISRSVFFKAFEIYIHAIKYDATEAFGCKKCPGPLRRGEKEEHFE